MTFAFFTIPVHDSGDSARELNLFLAAHKVLAVDRRWVEQGADSFWAFAIDYLDGDASSVGHGRDRIRNRIDYREILSPEDFAVFSSLRELRKEISQAEAVPVYAICTNEQLARIVQQRVVTKAGLAKIDPRQKTLRNFPIFVRGGSACHDAAEARCARRFGLKHSAGTSQSAFVCCFRQAGHRRC